jgi:hypothetical protein
LYLSLQTLLLLISHHSALSFCSKFEIFASTISQNSQNATSISTSNRVRINLVTKQFNLFLVFSTLQVLLFMFLHSNYFSKIFIKIE